jgi:uncharacterized 2Fe-2S/4Fe-4S cluster protein (DUF4445 family)
MRFSVRLDTSYHRPPHPLKDAGVVADSLTGIHNAMLKCLFVVNSGWVLLYISIRHDSCYWEHLAQNGKNERQLNRSRQYSLSCNSQIKCSRIHVDMDFFFSCFGM